jgi:hypothetical protein
MWSSGKKIWASTLGPGLTGERKKENARRQKDEKDNREKRREERGLR